MIIEKGFLFISESTFDAIKSMIDIFSLEGGGLCVISSKIPKGIILEKVPENVWVIDLRYGGLSIFRNKHPRQEGLWTQYSHLQTGLAKNITISDTITNNTKIENWESKPHSLQQAPYGVELTSEDYRHQHNHYQNLLCETFNFSDSLNAVSIWGDSAALVPGAKSWGAFFSARSWPVKWTGYTPEYGFHYNDEDFDAALVGIEIDVLNYGRDWGDPSPFLERSLAKIGLQIVGFGKKNTAAIEVRTEDSDDPDKTSETRRGAWQWGMIVRNALHKDSTLIHCENGEIKRGIDLSLSSFAEGALLISSGGKKSGIVFDYAESGQIYAEKDGQLVIQAGKRGLRIELTNGEYLSISNTGEVTITQALRDSLKKLLKEE